MIDTNSIPRQRFRKIGAGKAAPVAIRLHRRLGYVYPPYRPIVRAAAHKEKASTVFAEL